MLVFHAPDHILLSLSSLDKNTATSPPMLLLSICTSFERVLTPQRPVDFCGQAVGGYQNKVCSNLMLFWSPSSLLACRPIPFYDFASSDRILHTFKGNPCNMLFNASDSLFSLTGAFRLRSSSTLFESALLRSWLPLI